SGGSRGCAILGAMSGNCVAAVVGAEGYGNENYLLAVEAPEMAGECRPGQFVMAAEESGALYPSPLLKRALAVYSRRWQGRDGVLTLLLKVMGDGTRRLASLRAGDRVSLVGPLGNGFSLDEAAGRESFLVAGGIGIASFLLLAEELAARGERAVLVYGARSASDLIGIDDFERLGMPVYVSTDDGSRGIRGLVTGALDRAFREQAPRSPLILTCGPTPMMKAVAGWSGQLGLPCRISVENRMACGFGVCLGCTVKTQQGYRLACTHGPVFEAESFVFSERGDEGAP
ncbi:MAG TPA: dihydroorotate dehydrogenase electron transfer subunit, partial [Acidobacteriota bacterium]|nr:dihydroorotate dehydrogenase electron transfer subunit [Acidobacteriota bacterium]